MFDVTGPRPYPIITHIEIDSKALLMEVDTGAMLSVISEKTEDQNVRRSKPPKTDLGHIPDMFEDSHQAVKTEVAKIYVSDNAVPKYYKCWTLPYVMRDMVNKELDRLGLGRTCCSGDESGQKQPWTDDILVTGLTEEEHFQKIELVLERLAQAGFRLKASKCSFVSEVEYLGHRIDAEGSHSSGTTLSAINKAPTPTDITELRYYLGMVNHYGRFLPNLATVLVPMHQLLRKDAKWYWRKAQQEGFDRTKEMLNSPLVVTHFDLSKVLILTRDFSPDGLNKFHQYLWGRKFTIVTDNKPLLGLFGETKVVP
ncbi:hypothetical protein LSH36_697g00032 [Paralvinella palmiformis]|uniref:Reverse transcriptase domain-containing protein n=1 Tax=Paralvinella palmiformis TaxID=53620 RepID=A0AAD9MTT1_9ANNE|nr:hypothetical protein LSH36_697g00032 [Paralvinella palmiformis]